MSLVVDASGRDLRSVNTELKQAIAEGPVLVHEAAHLHGLVAGFKSGEVIIEEDSGDYLGVLNDGATIRVNKNAGRYLADSMTHGNVIVEGDAGYGVGAYCYGGTCGRQGQRRRLHGRDEQGRHHHCQGQRGRRRRDLYAGRRSGHRGQRRQEPGQLSDPRQHLHRRRVGKPGTQHAAGADVPETTTPSCAAISTNTASRPTRRPSRRSCAGRRSRSTSPHAGSHAARVLAAPDSEKENNDATSQRHVLRHCDERPVHQRRDARQVRHLRRGLSLRRVRHRQRRATSTSRTTTPASAAASAPSSARRTPFASTRPNRSSWCARPGPSRGRGDPPEGADRPVHAARLWHDGRTCPTSTTSPWCPRRSPLRRRATSIARSATWRWSSARTPARTRSASSYPSCFPACPTARCPRKPAWRCPSARPRRASPTTPARAGCCGTRPG